MNDVITRNLRTCVQCLRTKPKTSEYFGKRTGRWIAQCKFCTRTADRNRYDHNRTDILESKRVKRAADPDRFRRNARRSYARYRGKLSALAAVKYRTDPVHRLRTATRSRFYAALKAKGLKKNASWQKLVGYSVQDLKHHIDSLLMPPLTWDNYGPVWHIDHRIPVASFDLPRQIKECWALSNLQPLEKMANHRKGARIMETIKWPKP